MSSVTELLTTLEREYVLAAIKQLDAGTLTRFAKSTTFDVLYLGKRYAPKAVTGLALELMHGRPFGPSDFKGGTDSSAFRALRRCGFTIVPKAETAHTESLTDTVAEILSLQMQYAPENTPAMQRRGVLIRTVLRDLIQAQVMRYEPLFSAKGYECSVEGSDGKGRKVMSAWTRLYDSEMSPSATKGWYLVLHFSRRGDYFYLTLGCGATTFKDGSLVDVDSQELAQKIRWARKHFSDQYHLTERFSDEIKLHGNHLSQQFEKAIAFAKRYQPDGFDEERFWEDFTTLSSMLVDLYEAEKFGKVPLSEAPELIEHQAQLTQLVRPRTQRGRGQGRFLRQEEKVAVELRAMDVVRADLAQRGFTDITDTSAKESYDFTAKKDDVEWFIEVKGTTSASADTFMLTANELTLHREHKGRTVLAIVYDINLDRQGETPLASGGSLAIDIPWDPEQWDFKPTAYSALRKNSY
ncbi:MrcB family domain-containing protein [Pseudomonas sp. JZ134]|uniref:MrcB family domain-containing protein n=1 Tax=Pseudomonas sp. JZ134 TaxID=2806615 RepID=UPI003DA10A3F